MVNFQNHGSCFGWPIESKATNILVQIFVDGAQRNCHVVFTTFFFLQYKMTYLWHKWIFHYLMIKSNHTPQTKTLRLCSIVWSTGQRRSSSNSQHCNKVVADRICCQKLVKCLNSFFHRQIFSTPPASIKSWGSWFPRIEKIQNMSGITEIFGWLDMMLHIPGGIFSNNVGTLTIWWTKSAAKLEY